MRRIHRAQGALFAANDPSILRQTAELMDARPVSPARQALAERLRDSFNQAHPVGSPVLYMATTPQLRKTVVASPARVLPSGDVVVELEGVGASIPLRDVTGMTGRV